jgi:hypothetical protein
MGPDEKTEAEMAAARAELEALRREAELRADRSKRGRSSRRKGGSAERDVAAMAIAHGFTECRRNFGSGSRGGGDLIGIPGVSVEVKRQESLNVHKAFAQAEAAARPSETPVVAFKRNHGPWLACLELSEFFALLKASQL